MNTFVLISLILSALVDLSLQISTNDSVYYVAGVVEYYPSKNEKQDARMQENLDRYVEFIKHAVKKKVDVLVFPEATLNGGSQNRSHAYTLAEEVPDPNKKIIPCETKFGHLVKQLSCEAQQNKIYIVVNLSEREVCSAESQAAAQDTRPCATDAQNYYNTDVVFDRNGAVIARYRKFNLFGEKFFNTTKIPERVTFDTDFGVRFGLFTCFDIMFNEPALGLVRDGVKDFIFPTMWYSETPFLTALQIQEYWSYVNDVNLLAAGASDPDAGSGGSGIYAGIMGPLVNYMSYPQDDKSKNNQLLTMRVPKLFSNSRKRVSEKYGVLLASKEEPNMDKFRMLRDPINSDYTSELVENNFSKELCSGELCCTFDVNSKSLNKTEGTHYYQYRAIVGDVVRSFSGVINGGVKTCAVVACSGPDISSCGLRFTDSSKVGDSQIFERIHIQGNFPAIDEVFTMPNTLTHSMRPLLKEYVIYKEDNAQEEMKLVAIHLRGAAVRNLQTFGIYGRDFRKDNNSSSAIKGSYSVLFATVGYLLLKQIFNI